jgi:hypothetical protein
MAELRLAQETNVLAAAKAALDPNRVAWQHDILVSTIIEVLARKGPLTRRELREELRLTLVGQETPVPLLTQALERAQSQDLLLMVSGRKGREQWTLPEGVRAEAADDRKWAELLLAETEAEVASRLMREFPDDAAFRARAPRLTKDLVGAMVRASKDVFEAVQRSASGTNLRAVRFNLRSVVPDLRSRIQPRELADFMSELVISAASPDEQFGNELLSTIVAGQILHGMVCRDDVVGPMPAARLVFDTSQLLALASHDEAVVELFTSFLGTAKRHGCDLVVTDRVKREWDGHWQQADVFLSQLKGRWKDNLNALKLHQHKVLMEFGYSVDRGAKSFESWSQDRRNLDRFISQYSMTLVSEEELEFDSKFVETFADGIKGLQERDGRSRIRGAEARVTDAISADLVRSHRQSSPNTLVPTAWFVAFDRSSDLVYRDMADDDFPLVVHAATWMLHYAAFEGDSSSDARARFADRLSEDLIVGAFLSVAASYTNDEMLELGDLLSADDHLDAEDVRGFILGGFLNPDEVVESQLRDLARARFRRQSDRVARNKKIEGDRARSTEVELSRAQAEISSLKGQISTDSDDSVTLRRSLEAVIALGILAVALLLATTLHWFGLKPIIFGWLAFAYLLFDAVHYVSDHSSGRRHRIAAMGTAVVLMAAGILLDANVDWS